MVCSERKALYRFGRKCLLLAAIAHLVVASTKGKCLRFCWQDRVFAHRGRCRPVNKRAWTLETGGSLDGFCCEWRQGLPYFSAPLVTCSSLSCSLQFKINAAASSKKGHKAP
mmetsp:Transcript_77117/g.160549  ORF Transcript_77117/g.160549 Transcript_77117/m.160549 type:complete len:112 (-) Transcript_77117:282-617(-)